MRFKEFSINEAPIKTYQKIGDFDKAGPFSQTDKKLISSPVVQAKAEKMFDNIPHDIRLFFSNLPRFSSLREVGQISESEIVRLFGKNAEEILKDHEDAITVIFLGNFGSEKVPMTPWMMAHRIGHTTRSGASFWANQGDRIQNPWDAAQRHFESQIRSIIDEYYGVSSFYFRPRVFFNNARYQKGSFNRKLLNSIGTFRSARLGKISREYEFMYEMFAQYLTTGTIKFNPLPDRIDYGKKVFGRPTQMVRFKTSSADTVGGGAAETSLLIADAKKRKENANQELDILAHDMELMFNDVLSNSVGKIFLM